MNAHNHAEIATVALDFRKHTPDAMLQNAQTFLETMRRRRSVRDFSDARIPLEVVRACIEAAAQSPSGANKQPWTFALVTDPGLKKRIREAAEVEEREFYAHRAPRRWLHDLAALGTDEHKPFLEIAPALIVVFAQRYGASDEERNYYVQESVGIATGVLLAALQHAGLATLTHTPSPMNFLSSVLERPENERAFVLIPVGYPAEGCRVPAIARKPTSSVLVEYAPAERDTSPD